MSDALDSVLTDDELTGFFRLVGQTLFLIGHFEHQMAHIIVIVFKSPYETMEEAENALEQEFSRTLGRLLREYRNVGKLTPELDARISAFVDERNWLCHHLYARHHSDLYNRERFDALCNRLGRLSQEARGLSNEMEAVAMRWLATTDVTEKELERRARESIRRWRD